MDSSRARFKKSLSASSHSEEDDVEEWLSKNEDQAEAIVERWLCSHPQSAKNLYIKYGHFVGMDAMVPFSSVQKSKSMRNYISTPAIQKHQRKRRMSELRKLEKQQLFVELLKDVVSPDVDVNHLSHKILVNVLLLTKADRSSLFLVEGTGEDQVLVSRLFDVTEGISVTDAVHDEADAIKMALGVGVAGHVAESGEKINLENAYDVRLAANAYCHCRALFSMGLDLGFYHNLKNCPAKSITMLLFRNYPQKVTPSKIVDISPAITICSLPLQQV